MAGRAFVSLYVNNSSLVKGLKAAGQRMQSFGASIARIGGIMTGVGTAISLPFIGAIKAASDMEETMSKFSVVFGESADAVKAWSDDFAGAVGRSKQQIASFMAGAQDLFVPLGFAADAATDLSKQITTLAIDLGSFNNMADEDVMRDLQAALTGSGEVMKKYGVIVSEAAVKQELLNRGIDPKAATDQMKVQARLNLIMAGTTAAQGDAIRTSGGFANQMKALEGNIKDAAVAIGAALLPVVTPLVTKASAIIKILGAWTMNNVALVKTVAMVAAGIAAAGVAIVGIGGTISVLGMALGGIAGLLSGLAGLFGLIVSPIGLVVAAIVAGTAAFVHFTETGQWLANTLMGDFSTAFGTIKDGIKGVADALKAGEFRLAGEIAMTGLKLAFFEATKSIRTMWINFNKDLVGAMVAAADAILGVVNSVAIKINDAFGGMQVTWRNLKDWWEGVEYVAGRDDDIYAARNAAAESINATMGAWRETLDEFGKVVDEGLNTQLSDGQTRIAALRAELGKLKPQAATAVAKLPTTAPPGAKKLGGIDTGAKDMTAVTFSSAAAVALGQGGGTMSKLLNAAEERNRIAKLELEQLKMIHRQGGAMSMLLLP